MKKIRYYLGFFALVLPHTTSALTAPDPRAVYNKLKPGLDTTRALEKTVGSLRTIAKNVPGTGFKTNQAYYQLPHYIPDSLKTKMQATVETGDLATAVQQTTALSPEEQDFINNRLEHIAAYLQKNTGLFPDADDALAYKTNIYLNDPETLPRIAVCASGGGFRAMMATMGFWDGMQQTGLDNLVLMSSCLSGSTWFTMPWCIGKTIDQLRATYKKWALLPLGTSLINQVKTNPLALPSYTANNDCLFPERSVIDDKFKQAFYWNFPYNMVQPYGNLIGHMTLASFDDATILQKNGTTVTAQDVENAPHTGPNALQSRQTVYLSQAADFLKSPDGIASRPLPLATSITQYDGTWWSTAGTISNQQKSFDGYGWITYTPFNVEMDFYDRKGIRSGARIETQYLGRQFDNIRKAPKRWYRFTNPETIAYGAVNNAPEYTLDYLMGIWGSAFGISIDFILYGSGLENAVDPETLDATIAANKKPSDSFIMSSLKKAAGGAFTVAKTGVSALTSYGDFRLLPAVINNFAVFPDSPFVDHKTLVTVDAGIAFNLPFPPLLKPERNINMIIALDASADVSDGQLAALVGAEKWAAAHGVPFPKIATSSLYKGASTRAFTVFNEFDSSVPVNKRYPTIFYMPLIDLNSAYACNQNQPFSLTQCLKNACSTFNFKYAPEDVDNLSNHVSCAVKKMKPTILATIEQVIRQQNNLPLLDPTEYQCSESCKA